MSVELETVLNNNAIKSFALGGGVPPLNLTYQMTYNPNAVVVGVGNTVSFSPALSSVWSPSTDHQRTSLLVSATTQDDAHSEEQTLCVTTTINKGYLKPWARNSSFSIGDNIAFGGSRNTVYRCVQAGTSAATGDGPTGKTAGILDGTVRWDWINDAAIASKVGFYNEVKVDPGAGQCWAQSNNIQLFPGVRSSFAVNTEFDFTNNSGVDSTIGGAVYEGIYLGMAGSNRSTTGIHVTGHTSAGNYAAIWGMRFDGEKLAEEAVIAVDSSSKVGLSFGGSGFGGSIQSVTAIHDASSGQRSLFVTGNKTVAVIDDLSASPTGINVGGTKSLCGIQEGSTTPIGIKLSGNYGTAQIAGNGWGVEVFGKGLFTKLKVSGLTEAVDDIDAANKGVAVNDLYRTGSVLKIRVS